MNCIHYDNGVCRYASSIAEIPIHPTEYNCKNCQIHDSVDNPVLYSLCVVSLNKQGLFDKVKHLPLIAKTHVISSKDTLNRPGTCLRNILQALGIYEGKACGCDEYAHKMDVWGSNGCEQRIHEIIDHLNSQSISWFDIVKVVLGGYLSTHALVTEAIRCSRNRLECSKEPS